MAGGLYGLIEPLLASMEPERAHRLTVSALRMGLVPRQRGGKWPSLRIRLAGLDFPNPVGLAAGFDKNAEVPDAALGLGFGFVEVGTVTPNPQAGNPRPRIFRLGEDRAVINRLGFNNDGHAAVLKRLEARRAKAGIVGVNIGANKDSTDRIGDYVRGFEAFHGVASYITVNISSPNTPGLRDLQRREDLKALIGRLNDARERTGGRPPLFLKIAPDLDDEELVEIGYAAIALGIDAVIVSNTTLARPALRSAQAQEQGGLSGRPLFELSTLKLAVLHAETAGRLPLIGVGGIDSPERAWAKLEAGASLVQLYTGLVYEGPGLVRRICQGLSDRLAAWGGRGRPTRS
jgi:dihydroorotate dehydrogenase